MTMRSTVAALNNIGVSLMRRNCFAQAKKTFGAALGIMQQELSEKDAAYLLKRASKRLSRPCPLQNSYVQINVQDDDNCHHDTTIIHHVPKQQQQQQQQQQQHFNNNNNNNNNNKPIVNVIPIDDLAYTPPPSSTHGGTTTDGNDEVERACIIHNYALSLLCLSHSTDITTTASTKSLVAFKEKGELLLELALTMLENNSEDVHGLYWYGFKLLSVLNSLNVVVTLRVASEQQQQDDLMKRSSIITSIDTTATTTTTMICDNSDDDNDDDDNKSSSSSTNGSTYEDELLSYIADEKARITEVVSVQMEMALHSCAAAA